MGSIRNAPLSEKDVYSFIDCRLWERMKKIAPDLEPLVKDVGYPADYPSCLTDFMFVAFLASFANPLRREIARQVIMDVIAAEVSKLIDKAKEGGAD